jgi:hypothetical protein
MTSPDPPAAAALHRRATDRPISATVLVAFTLCAALAIVGFVVLSLAHVDAGPLAGIITAFGAVAVPALAALLKLDRVSAKVDAVAVATGDRLDARIETGAGAALTGLMDPQFFAGSADPPPPGKPASSPAGKGGA